MGTGFCDASVLHGPTTPYTMERMTLIVPRSKSVSPHFKPNIPLCRNLVDAARRTSVCSRRARPSINDLTSAGTRNGEWCSAFRALTNEPDWVAVKPFISAGVIEQNGHLVLDFGAAASVQPQVIELRRRKAMHSTRFARPCPSALCLNILLRRNGGARG
jgi:hypothetical protein